MNDPRFDRDAPVAQLMKTASGYWLSQALYVATKLGIADILAGGAMTPAELASATGSHADSLYRILRALAAQGIFAEDEAGRFGLTELARPLCADSESSVRGYVLMLGSDWHWRAWGELLHSARTGEPAFDHVFGKPIFDYFAEEPEPARTFADAMTSRSAAESAAITRALSFDKPGTVVDVGGGQGTMLAAILDAHPQMRGMLFDLPHVVEMARPVLSEKFDPERCRIVEGDFFETVPAGGDVYLMRRILHDWDDERAATILRNCRAAMAKGGRVVILELMLPPTNVPGLAKLLDLQMLVLTSKGRERSEAEYGALLAATGFRLEGATPVAGELLRLSASRSRQPLRSAPRRRLACTP